MQPDVVGWDIGGANVKAVTLEDQKIRSVHQLPCPLWKGIDKLADCINQISKLHNDDLFSCLHAVTMTGELVDHFDNRAAGVTAIVGMMSEKLLDSETRSTVRFFAGINKFIDPNQAIKNYVEVASANWLASVNYAAIKVQDALFIDIGSTTTDIIEIRDHKINNAAYTDEERLIAKELVYSGVIRTPIFAISQFAQVKNRRIPVINEYFSNTADVYRLTGELPEYADLGDTLDGRDKDVQSSAVRLARMYANDANQEELEIWRGVAMQIRNNQLQLIKDACRHQLMKNNIALATPIIGAGVGRFLVKELASQLGREYVDFDELFELHNANEGFNVGDCAPAAAVASLVASISR